MFSVFRSRRNARKNHRPTRSSRTYLRVEALEDRLVPSSVVDSLFIGDVNFIAGSVKQLDAATGAFQTTFVPGDQRLVNPTGMIFDQGHTLLVDDFRYPRVRGEVLQSNGQTDYGTAHYLLSGYDEFFNVNLKAPYDPRGICQGPDNTVFVADLGDLGNRDGTNLPGRLIQFDANGKWIRDLTATGPFAGPSQVQFDTKNGPRGIVIGPDGYLYVAVRSASGKGGEIMKFDPNSGQFLGDFVEAAPVNDLNRPEGLVFGPDGNLYVTSFSSDDASATTAVTDTDKILEFDGTTGHYIGKIDLDQIGQPRAFAQALLFGPDDKLFVPITGNGPDTGSIRRYDAGTGTYDVFVQPRAQGGPLEHPWYLTFGNTDPSTLAYKTPNLNIDRTFIDLGTTTYPTPLNLATYSIQDNNPNGNVLITAPKGVEVSTDGKTWSTSLTLTPTNGMLANTLITVRSSNGSNAASLGGVIKNTDGNGEVDVTVRGTIKRATLTITPTPGQSMVYGTDFGWENLTYTANGFVNNDTPALLSGTLYSDAFDYLTVGNYNYYTWWLSAGPNYQVVLAADAPTFAITPAPLTITPDANQSMVYGSEVPSLTYTATGFAYWDWPAYTLTGTLGTTATLGSPAGNYAFTTDGFDAGPNYTIVLAQNAPTFTVTPAKLRVVADAQTKTYGSADPALTYSAIGFQLDDTSATVLSGHLDRAPGETVLGGPYAITQGNLVANSNYAIAFTGSSLSITQAVTATKVAGSGSQSVFGQAVILTATVSLVPGAGAITGTVTFMDGNITLGNATLDSSGLATFTTSKLAVGTHTITAIYSGDPNCLASTSTVFTQRVLSAQQELGLIINQVTDMVTKGLLDSGNGNALIVKLNNAIASLNQGNITAGDNQLNAFINQTNAFLKSGKLDSTDALELISEIDLAIAAALTSPT